MGRDDMADLMVFLMVARERSFTRAAAKLGLSQSTLSHIVTRLEQSLGIRLLTRTTRSVATTEAGDRLLGRLAPAVDDLDAIVASLSEFREKPAGTIRITSVEHAAKTVIWPALKRLLPDYPDITVEVTLDYSLVDIVAERFDAGVRLGEHVAQDMIAVRLTPDLPMAVVGSPDYFTRHPPPSVPQELLQHRCINLRLPTSGGLYVWEFARKGSAPKVRVGGPLVFNTIDLILDAALAGFGLAYVVRDHAQADIENGRLVSVLDEWCKPLPGYHLYYPSRRQPTPAFALLVKALRQKV
jgi:DNA-binding transcriptional LysR family regulator